MELVAQTAAVCVVAALLALVLKRSTPETALVLTMAAVAAAGVALAQPLEELVRFLRETGQRSGMSQTLFYPLYKTVGIALVVRVGASLCRDAGESALAAAVEMAGAICALVVSLPLLEAVLSLLMELIA